MKQKLLFISLCAMPFFGSAQTLYNNGATLHISSGATVQVNGTVTNNTGAIANGGTLVLTGNFTNNATVTATSTSTLRIEGSSGQTFNGTTAINAGNVVMNNPSGLTLLKPLQVDGGFTFSSGHITGSGANHIIFTANASVVGTATDASHLIGFARKLGTGSFTYPVGRGGKYQPIAVNLSVNSGFLQAGYIPGDAGTGTFSFAGTDPIPLTAYNTGESWSFTTGGTVTGTVTVFWDGYKDDFPYPVAQRRVARKIGNGMPWLNMGGTGTGTTTVGSITSTTTSSWGGYIALGAAVFLETWYQDSDGDGFGNAAVSQQAATKPDGYVADNTDCNDENKDEHPGQVWFIDADGDGYTAFSQISRTNSGNTANTPVAASNILVQCERPQHGKLASELKGNDDCNDADEKEHPGQTWYIDADGDGYAAYTMRPLNPALTVSLAATAVDPNVVESCTRPAGGKLASELTGFDDCDDDDKTVHPGATEIAGNSVDEDCDGLDAKTWYEDGDGDGFGNAAVSKTANDKPTGFVADNTDCDDTKVTYADGDGDGYGAGDPVACGVASNDDCNDENKDEHPGQTWYIDADGDGYGASVIVFDVKAAPIAIVPGGGGIGSCTRPLNGFLLSELKGLDDCDDANAARHPGATEIAGNGVDEDCDGLDAKTWYEDKDGDGFGNAAVSKTANDKPTGFVADNTDCDDTKVTYADGDGDGYGAGNPVACGVASNDDCNDENKDEHPGQTWYIDADGDGYAAYTMRSLSPALTGSVEGTEGDPNWVISCTRPANGKLGSELKGFDDCNDSDKTVHPGATEIAGNGVDEDCDGLDLKTWYEDKDGDGFGNPGVSKSANEKPTGFVADNTDCDDTKVTYADGDGDGFGAGLPVACGVASNDDCNDSDNKEHPGQTWFIDADGDGYGASVLVFDVKAAPIAIISGDGGIGSCTRPLNGFLLSELKGLGDCNDNNKDVWRNLIVYTDTDGDGYTVGFGEIRCIGETAPAGFALVKSATDDCNDNNKDVHSKQSFYVDADGDGYDNGTALLCAATAPAGYSATTKGTDCDDANAARHPGATEIADNGVDEDCDGLDLKTWYEDGDSDGFGNAGVSKTANEKPAGFVADNKDCDDTKVTYADGDGDGFGAGANTPCGVATNTDCDDKDNTIYPGALDVPDGKDNDCSGTADDGPQVPFYQDKDGDGFGNPNVMVLSSKPVNGYVRDNQDCNDNRISYRDADNDGWGTSEKIPCGWISRSGDCDDNDRRIHTPRAYYRDADGDKYGDPANSVVLCTSVTPAGYTTNNTDCDDTNPTARVGTIFYRDADGDGFGDSKNYIIQCSYVAPAGYTSNNQDCNDSGVTYADKDGDGFGAGAKTACGVANNTDCNDNDNKVNTPQTFYRDADGDGFGDGTSSTMSCSGTIPVGYVSNSLDCNDAQTYYEDRDGDGFGSMVTVACGGVTNNTDCNDSKITYEDKDGDGFGSAVKAACGAANSTDCDDTQKLYQDSDGDGFGSAITVACNGVTNNKDCNDSQVLYQDGDGDGFGAGLPAACGVASNTDCNDADSKVNVPVSYFLDADKDGFGNAAVSTQTCSSLPPAGYVSNSLDCDDSKITYADNDKDGFGAGPMTACGVTSNTDCNDGDVTVYPGAPELADGKDNNCDQQVDEGLVKTWYLDKDGDGFGNPKVFVVSGSQPAGYVANNLDCDDRYLTYEDKDGDGWGNGTLVPCGWVRRTGDCNDNDRRLSSPRTWYRDADGDKYGDPTNTLVVCQADAPAGYVSNNTDCDDTNAAIRTCPASSPLAASTEALSVAGLQADGPSLSASPNPFGGRTRVQYGVPKEGRVDLRLFNAAGREVGLLFQGVRAAGQHSQEYNARPLAQGVYYLRLSVAQKDGKVYRQTVKLVKAQ